MQHKKFMNIERLKTSFVDGFNKGDHIIIQEKIDGANCAIRYDSVSDSIVCQSRKQILNEINNLRGFYEWGKTLDKELVKSILGNNLVLFGEWLVPHTVVYPKECYHHAYFYDCYDLQNETYLSQSEVKAIVGKLELTYVPVFYDGEFTSWEHCKAFVGQTQLGGDVGEGIVVKNLTRLNDSNTRLPFYTKLISEKFSETKAYSNNKKNIDPEELKSREQSKELTSTIVTRARVEKILNKFVDEGILPEDWSSSEMSIVAKNLPKAVYEDCVEEESDIVKQIMDFGKVANGICMRIARDIMKER